MGGEDFGRRTSLTVRVNRVHLGEEDMSSCRLMLSSWEDRDVGSLPLSEAAGTDLICLGLTEKNFCVNDISDEASLLDFMQGPAARREPKILSEAVPSWYSWDWSVFWEPCRLWRTSATGAH